jgi:hypothetical protein
VADSQSFLARRPLPQEPFPEPDLRPYQDALAAAPTPAEFSTVLNALLDAVEPFLRKVVDHLQQAAEWRGQHRGAERGTPPRLLQDAAGRISSAFALAAAADVQLLLAHYDPPTDLNAATKKTLGAHSTPPSPPPLSTPASHRRNRGR